MGGQRGARGQFCRELDVDAGGGADEVGVES
jgi:hypothetical protein